jgi:hypothetical protein
VKGHRTKPFSKRALQTWANSSYHAIPVVEPIQQAEREAEKRAQALAEQSKPFDEQVAALAARWGARVTA